MHYQLQSCPDCGSKAIETVTSDYSTELGFLIHDLERLHCNSCGGEFFDSAAMTRILSEGRLARRVARRRAQHSVTEATNV